MIKKIITMTMILFTICCSSEEGQEVQTGGGYSTFSLNFQAYPQLETYESCEALRSDLNMRIDGVNQYWANYRRPEPEYTSTVEYVDEVEGMPLPDAAVESEPDVEGMITNTQERGVDEADNVKRNQFHIYVQRGNQIQVIERTTMSLIGTISIEGEETALSLRSLPSSQVEEVIVYRSSSYKMYADGNRLVVLGNEYAAGQAAEAKIKVYETLAGEIPNLISNFASQGLLTESRFINGIVYAVIGDQVQIDTQPTANGYYHYELSPDQFKANTFRGRPCQRIIRSPANDFNLGINHVLSINTRANNPADTAQSQSLLGASIDNIYVGQGSIYMYSSHYFAPYYNESPPQGTTLTEILYDRTTGELKPVGRGWLPGVPAKGTWSFKQFSDGVLSAVTTTGQPLLVEDSAGLSVHQNLLQGRNHLWLLKPEATVHEIKGSVINFGKPREDVRSVRYIDDKAYVVTFEKTDPLYSIDLTQRDAPVVVDALEIPGFSMYMHPLNENFLVGVGFDAVDMGSFSLFQGIQVSLFDISGDASVLTDKRIFGVRGSYSEVSSDHKAFFFNPNDLTFALPLTELGYTGGQSPPYDYGRQLLFQGAVIMGFDTSGTEGKLVEKARISHSDLIPELCHNQDAGARWWMSDGKSYNISRMFINDDSIISVSRFGLKSHHPVTYEVEQTIEFPLYRDGC